jgi:hypothetical protein
VLGQSRIALPREGQSSHDMAVRFLVPRL